jgi:hemolysin type calcium-binding protein
MRSGLRLAVLMATLFASGVAPAQAQQVLDQQQITATAFAVVAQEQSRAQTFTAGRTGTLDRVDLFLYRGPDTVQPLTLEIRNTVGGMPGSTVLASATLMPADVPNGPGAAAFVAITFTPGAPVVAGTQYAIVLYSTATTSASGSASYHWGRAGNLRPLPPAPPDGYPEGTAFSSPTTPPSEWIDLFLADQAFITYVVPGDAVEIPRADCRQPTAGTASSDSPSLTEGNDAFDGRGGNDRLIGRGGHDCLLGGAGSDTLSGDAGNDTLSGATGNDNLLGGDGDDDITGGSGSDDISGGAGNDVIDVFDSAGSDDVSCGAGRDTVYADAGDDIAGDCENVVRRERP